MRTNATLSAGDQVSLTGKLVTGWSATAEPRKNPSAPAKLMLAKVHKQSHLSNLAQMSTRYLSTKDRTANHHIKRVHKHTACTNTYGPSNQVAQNCYYCTKNLRTRGYQDATWCKTASCSRHLRKEEVHHQSKIFPSCYFSLEYCLALLLHTQLTKDIRDGNLSCQFFTSPFRSLGNTKICWSLGFNSMLAAIHLHQNEVTNKISDGCIQRTSVSVIAGRAMSGLCMQLFHLCSNNLHTDWKRDVFNRVQLWGFPSICVWEKSDCGISSYITHVGDIAKPSENPNL